MAITSGFFNGADRLYDAVQMSSIFDGVIRDGIFESVGKKLVTRPSSGNTNTVIVGTGRAWFNHTWLLNDTDLNVVLSAPEVVLNRIDAIVLDFNGNVGVRENTIKVIKGVPSTNPQIPARVRSEEHNQYMIAHILRKPGEGVALADITVTCGSIDAPWVIAPIVSIDLTLLTNRLNAEWATWWVPMKTASEKSVNDLVAEFVVKFTNLETANTNRFNTLFTSTSTSAADLIADLDELVDTSTAAMTALFADFNTRYTTLTNGFQTGYNAKITAWTTNYDNKMAAWLLAYNDFISDSGDDLTAFKTAWGTTFTGLQTTFTGNINAASTAWTNHMTTVTDDWAAFMLSSNTSINKIKTDWTADLTRMQGEFTTKMTEWTDDYTAKELARKNAYDDAQTSRSTAFNTAQSGRVTTFNNTQAARVTAFDTFMTESDDEHTAAQTARATAFTTFMSTSGANFDTMMTSKGNTFDTWFAALQAALDGNIATKLTADVLALQNTKADKSYVDGLIPSGNNLLLGSSQWDKGTQEDYMGAWFASSDKFPAGKYVFAFESVELRSGPQPTKYRLVFRHYGTILLDTEIPFTTSAASIICTIPSQFTDVFLYAGANAAESTQVALSWKKVSLRKGSYILPWSPSLDDLLTKDWWQEFWDGYPDGMGFTMLKKADKTYVDGLIGDINTALGEIL